MQQNIKSKVSLFFLFSKVSPFWDFRGPSFPDSRVVLNAPEPLTKVMTVEARKNLTIR